MAVYTVLDGADIRALLTRFDLGELIRFAGIEAGVENSNYFVDLQQGQHHQHYVLTLFEGIDTEALGFYSELTCLLNRHGMAVPCPVADRSGQRIQQIKGKPALLTPRVPGDHPLTPSTSQCRRIGEELARLHICCAEAGLAHPGFRDLDWIEATARQLQVQADPGTQQLLVDSLAALTRLRGDGALPHTVIHGDLFRDNALFDGEQLTGIIDFNSAGNGYMGFDLAVTVNDWCSDDNGTLLADRYRALLAGYQSIRPLSDAERRRWQDMLVVAASRFWLSRWQFELEQQDADDRGQIINWKDPAVYRRILHQRMNTAAALD